MKKVNALACVAYFCNFLFEFFLLVFWLWKSSTYMLFMLGFRFQQKQHFLKNSDYPYRYILELYFFVSACVCVKDKCIFYTHTLTKEYSFEIYLYRKIYVIFWCSQWSHTLKLVFLIYIYIKLCIRELYILKMHCHVNLLFWKRP